MKRVSNKKFLMLLGVLTLTIALGGCQGKKDSSKDSTNDSSSQSTNSEPTMGGSIVVGIPQDIEDSLDPHKAVAAGTKEILFNLFEGLVKPDETGNLIDAVASAHTISEDGRTYTFTLRDGVKFHNGAEVTADDVIYSIERCADTSNGEPLVSAFSIIGSVTKTDEKTISISLTEPDTEFLSYLTTPIVPKDSADLDTAPIGTGPFMYVSRSPQENIKIKKFDGYWGTPAYLDDVTFKVLSDSNAIVTNLKSGAVDMVARINSTQSAELEGKFTIYEGGMNLIQALYLNHSAEPFHNVKVRQAMAYATNSQEVMDMIADGKGTEIGSSMYPAFEKYYVPELADLYATDVNKAKELLAEAGYPDGFSMTITVPSNYQQHVDTAQVLKEQLKKIGIEAEIKLIEWDSWLSDVYTGRNYESTVVGVDASYLSARALLERFTSDSPVNFINFSNAQYDELYAKVRSSIDDAEQTKLYKQMETILAEQAANIYIQDMASEVALNPVYAGYTFYPLYVQDMAKIYIHAGAQIAR